MAETKDRLGTRLIVSEGSTDSGGLLVEITLSGAQFDADSFIQLRPPEARKLAREIHAAVDQEGRNL